MPQTRKTRPKPSPYLQFFSKNEKNKSVLAAFWEKHRKCAPFRPVDLFLPLPHPEKLQQLEEMQAEKPLTQWAEDFLRLGESTNPDYIHCFAHGWAAFGLLNSPLGWVLLQLPKCPQADQMIEDWRETYTLNTELITYIPPYPFNPEYFEPLKTEAYQSATLADLGSVLDLLFTCYTPNRRAPFSLDYDPERFEAPLAQWSLYSQPFLESDIGVAWFNNKLDIDHSIEAREGALEFVDLVSKFLPQRSINQVWAKRSVNQQSALKAHLFSNPTETRLEDSKYPNLAKALGISQPQPLVLHDVPGSELEMEIELD